MGAMSEVKPIKQLADDYYSVPTTPGTRLQQVCHTVSRFQSAGTAATASLGFAYISPCRELFSLHLFSCWEVCF